MPRFPQPHIRFLKPCEHRVPNIEANIEAYMDGKPQPPIDPKMLATTHAPLCMLLTKEAGMTVGVTAKTCAQCMYADNSPNPAFIHERKASAYTEMVEMCKLGFYAEADIEDILKRAYPFMKDHPKRRFQLIQALQGITETGKLSLPRVEKLVTEHMKEFLNEPTNSAKSSGGAGGAPKPSGKSD